MALEAALPILYRAFSLRPVDKRKVVILEHTESGIDQSFATLYRELGTMGDVKVRFMSTKNMGGAVGRIRGYLNVVREIATAKAVAIRSTSFLINALPMRKDTKVAQLWHACGAFKRFGASIASPEGTRGTSTQKAEDNKTSLVTVSSEEVVWAFVEAMRLQDRPEVVKPIGISRTDVFFDADYLQASRELVFQRFPQIAGRSVILYAPTFRNEPSVATSPDELDIPALKERLGEHYALLIKHHPIVADPPQVPESCRDFALVAPADCSINDLMCASDICVTDYSSLVFEWSLFEKPTAFFAFDLDSYLDERGFYYDYDSMTPGPILKTTEELGDWILSLDEGFDRTEIHAFRERFMGACDGHSTERIIAEMLAD